MSTRTLPSIKFLQRIKKKDYRNLVWRLAQDVWAMPDCEHFTDVLIKNPFHTSHADNRPHITLRMSTPAQLASKSGQTIYIYYDEATQQYDAFRLYSERKDDAKDEPAEEQAA
ncbi:MAG: hypothetical protein Q9224_006204 [Gallowayella concinna]